MRLLMLFAGLQHPCKTCKCSLSLIFFTMGEHGKDLITRLARDRSIWLAIPTLPTSQALPALFTMERVTWEADKSGTSICNYGPLCLL
ncbi:hypothetical protein B0I35DRAFT_425231 [Stachybotrys elegans]|uniref:Uncharacterized protein n=1 Tax=Stachybotrys elegans TaxID=80388 RepID=A0A8K0SWG6_9HYPO|nr:hypothetical protein B0I35DRAFT_425231 [Stachybotrys elegans]